MKTLEQIQEENRKLIILANNKEAKSYEEVIKKIHDEKFFRSDLEGDFERMEQYIRNDYDLTLDKVLLGFKDLPLRIAVEGDIITKDKILEFREYLGLGVSVSLFEWDLTKPTLDQQTQQTQIEINKLLTE